MAEPDSAQRDRGRSFLSLIPITGVLAFALAVFFAIGMFSLGFADTWLDAVAALVSASIAELVFASVSRRRIEIFFPTSAITAALGICIFFRALSPWYFALAAVLAIGSKYVIRVRGRHLFNPSNFGILALAFLVPWACTIEFTQWGNDAVVLSLIVLAALLIALRAGVILTSVSFLVSYTVLLFVALGIDTDRAIAHHLGLLSPSLILFASFMITDPRTSPSGRGGRLFHGLTVALLYFSLEFMGVRYALFAASFLTTLLYAIERFFVPKLKERFAGGYICTSLFCAALFAALAFAAGSFSMPVMSTSLLLLGVESPSQATCVDPAFTVSKSGVQEGAETFGVAWGDYDGDGLDDLFVSNVSGETSRLYHNNGDGTFTDVTKTVGLPSLYSSSALFAHVFSNTPMDLVVSRLQSGPVGTLSKPVVFEYDPVTSKFEDVSERSGLSKTEPLLGTAYLSLADFDGKGQLDLLMTSSGAILNPVNLVDQPFVKASRDPFYEGARAEYLACGDSEVRSILSSHEEIFPDPLRNYATGTFLAATPAGEAPCLQFSSDLNLTPNLPGAGGVPAHILTRVLILPGQAELFENTGKSFERNADFSNTVAAIQNRSFVARTMYDQPFTYTSGRFFQPVSFDYNGDGKPDIFLTAGFGSDVLLKNDGNYRFSDVTATSGIGYYATGMGADVGDYNGDGLPDLIVTNVGRDYLFENRGDGTFVNHALDIPLGVDRIGWGVSFLDYDRDGKPDILIENGITTEYTADLLKKNGLVRPIFRLNELYRNTGNGFSDASTALCTPPANGKALAIADANEDGSLEAFLGTIGSGDTLLRSAPRNHFLEIRLQGAGKNPDAIGARVSVTAGTTTETEFVLAGRSFASENGKLLLFGLGTNLGPVHVSVQWPSGSITQKTTAQTDQIFDVRE